ncbi:hypothetical protein HYV88_00940 [Candidatus Woesearchaeota archaeon]|nr:hypothetical protein [Candidatus Woesearchaeota archaeon]
MAGKRTKTDIIHDMLSSIIDKGMQIKPTHLMYRSNLSHSQMTLYLEELVRKNFIKKIDKSGYGYLIITDKGLRFVQKFREMKEFEKAFGL